MRWDNPEENHRNVWGDVGQRYLDRPAPEKDAIVGDEVRWGDTVPFELFVGNGGSAGAFALDRPAYFSEEKTITQVSKVSERDWKLALSCEWLNPLEGLLEDGLQAMVVLPVFRIRHGLGSFAAEFLVSPLPLAAIPPPLAPVLVPIPFPDIGAPYVVIQASPLYGFQGGIAIVNDISEYRLSLIGSKLPPLRSYALIDVPSANFALSCYLCAIPLSGGATFAGPRTLRLRAVSGIAPVTRGSKL